MDKIFNFELVRNPFNWAMVAGFVIVGGLALHLIFGSHPTQEPAQ